MAAGSTDAQEAGMLRDITQAWLKNNRRLDAMPS